MRLVMIFNGNSNDYLIAVEEGATLKLELNCKEKSLGFKRFFSGFFVMDDEEEVKINKTTTGQ